MNGINARGEATIRWRGEPVRLRPSFVALDALEEATGKTVFELVDRMANMRMRARDVAIIAHAAIKAGGDVKATLTEVEEQIISDGLSAWVGPVSSMLAGCLQGSSSAQELADTDPPSASPA